MTLGKDLMLFINGKTVQFATSHTFEFEQNFTQVSRPDKYSDVIGTSEYYLPTNCKFSITTHNAMQWSGDINNTDITTGNTFFDLLQLGCEGNAVDIVFSLAERLNVNSEWIPAGTQLIGKGFISSTNLTADINTVSYFSIRIEGQELYKFS